MKYLDEILMKKILFLSLALFCLNAQCDIASSVNEHLKTFIKNNNTQMGVGISDLRAREIVSNLFFNNTESRFHGAQVSKVINANLVSDLDFFTDEEAENLFIRLNQTETIFGEIFLINNLLSLTNDIEVLGKSQDFVRKLIENEKVFEKIKAELENIKKNQKSFLSLFTFEERVVQDLFFKNKILANLNRSSLATSALNSTITFLSWAFLHLGSLPRVVAENTYRVSDYNYKEYAKKAASIFEDYLIHNSDPKKVFLDPFLDIYKDFKFINAQPIEVFEQAIISQGHDRKMAKKAAPLLKTTGKLFSGMHGLITLYSSCLKLNFYKNLYLRRQITNKLQKQLVEVASIIRSFQNIKRILKNELGIEISNDSINSDLENVIQNLSSSIFQNVSSEYFEGKVLSTYYKLRENKYKFADIFAQVGNVDSYMSVASLVKRNNMCFVEFIESNKPQIQSKNFWNLFIDRDKVVINSLEIDKNIILSGANAGGKTTAIKALLQNLVLAQTFGVATGSEFKFTPFKKISSYLNIVDDISSGKSLFKAEVERAKEMIRLTETLNVNEFGFCAIDELFTGTASEAGESCAKELVEKLNQKVNAQFIFATHYQKLTGLEKENSERVENYMMNPPVTENGKLKYPFTLKRGINTINVAREIIAEEMLI
jgi:DNA mismatch repair ATPase MutS